jgi:selenophosphate synthetase-related protein
MGAKIMDVKRYGDLQLIPLGHDYLVIACDSSGSIGNKENDQIKLAPNIAGYYAAFVPIVECMAVRGEIISVVDTLSVEMDPTGMKIIEGIQQAVIESGALIQQITGSTEDNMKTSMTGIGITVIGKVAQSLIIDKHSSAQKNVYLLGKAKVGQEFLEDEILNKKGEVLSLRFMRDLVKKSWVEQMLPVGSKGIIHEITVLQERYHCKICVENQDIDVHKSAGPATCLLITVAQKDIEKIKQLEEKIPVTYIGRFKE